MGNNTVVLAQCSNAEAINFFTKHLNDAGYHCTVEYWMESGGLLVKALDGVACAMILRNKFKMEVGRTILDTEEVDVFGWSVHPIVYWRERGDEMWDYRHEGIGVTSKNLPSGALFAVAELLHRHMLNAFISGMEEDGAAMVAPVIVPTTEESNQAWQASGYVTTGLAEQENRAAQLPPAGRKRGR